MVPQLITQPPASSDCWYISDVDARKMVVCILNVHVEDTVCLVLFVFEVERSNIKKFKEPEIGDDAD